MFCSGSSRATRGRDRRRAELLGQNVFAVGRTPSKRTPRRPRRARRLLAAALRLVVLIALVLSACRPALAVQSVRVSADSDAIDLTRAVEHYSAQGDRIQVSTAPGADGIVRRIEVSALEAGRAAGLDRVRADQRFRRATDPPDRRAPLPPGRLGHRLAGPRLLAHHHDHREPGPGAGAGGQRRRRTFSG